MVTLLIFIIILGAIIFIHESGHFLFAKLTGIYVHEFALGMGPKLISHKGKETTYSLRLIPIGGFCQLAGEEGEEENIPKERTLQGKKAWQRFLVMFFGAGFNFISAILMLFFIGLIFGSVDSTPLITSVNNNSRAEVAGLQAGDVIKEINGHKINTRDDISLYLTIDKHKKATEFVVTKTDGSTKNYSVTPEKKIKDDQVTYVYGISFKEKKDYGFIPAVKYMVTKTGALFRQMWVTVASLFTGSIKVKQLSGPVGIYEVVGSQRSSGLAGLLYLFAFLSINVGFINLLPLPAFDGGHILFIVIEKIKGSPVKAETEAMIHTIGLFLLMILMVYVTFNDILKLF